MMRLRRMKCAGRENNMDGLYGIWISIFEGKRAVDKPSCI
jgi:hypothetical protein